MTLAEHQRLASFQEISRWGVVIFGIELRTLIAQHFHAIHAVDDFLIAAHFHFGADPFLRGEGRGAGSQDMLTGELAVVFYIGARRSEITRGAETFAFIG